MKQTTLKWLAIIYTLIILLIIFMADKGDYKWFFNAIHGIPYADKFGHFILIGLLTLFINLAINCASFEYLNRRWLIASVTIFILISLEEVSQLFFINRHFDWGDLIANWIGIAFFSWVALRLVRGGIYENCRVE